ncbi:leucine-rich repeat domain-containing protein [Aquimarina addita]
MKIKFIIIYVISLIFTISCTKEIVSNDIAIEQSDEKNILEFSILAERNGALLTDAQAIIDEDTKTINIVMPYGISLESLQPSIVYTENASIYPDPLQAQDFSIPVVYTITAEDGTEVMYQVFVTAAAVSQKVALIALIEANPDNSLEWDLLESDIGTWEGVTVSNGQVTELTLVNKNIKVIPPEIGSLYYLTKLTLNENQITEIPEEISLLYNNLESFNIGANRMTTVPPELFELTNLVWLGIAYNSISEIPEGLSKLEFLKTIYLSGNNLTEFPEELLALPDLEEVYINSNDLVAIPEELNTLNWEVFNLGNNPITALPEQIFEMPELTQLILSNMGLTNFPAGITSLKKIENLNASNNSITTVDAELGELTTLKYLSLENNQIVEIAPEIGNLTNLTILRLQNNLIEIIPKEVCDLIELGVEIERDETAVCEEL